MSGEPGLFANLLPAGVAAADILDTGQDVALRAEEAIVVAAAGDKRRRDFALGRHCAHLALERIGATAAAILSGPRGAPQWPKGVTGSITHTNGYAAAIAAPCNLFRGLGLDAEHIGNVTEELFPKLFAPDEQEWLMCMAADFRAQTATVMFSAKEAYCKAAGQNAQLRFRDLTVALERDEVSVQAADGTRFTGRCIIARNIAIVLVSLPV